VSNIIEDAKSILGDEPPFFRVFKHALPTLFVPLGGAHTFDYGTRKVYVEHHTHGVTMSYKEDGVVFLSTVKVPESWKLKPSNLPSRNPY